MRFFLKQCNNLALDCISVYVIVKITRNVLIHVKKDLGYNASLNNSKFLNLFKLKK